MSRKSQFADDAAEEVEERPLVRKRLRPAFSSPGRSTWGKPPIRAPVPVLILIHEVPSGPRADKNTPGKLNGVVSIIFPKDAHDLREALKPAILYDAMQAMKFHWGMMRFANIDPKSTPLNPVFTAPPVEFIEIAAEACDGTEYCSDYEIRIGGERGKIVQLEDAKDLPWELPVTMHAHAHTHTQARVHTHTHTKCCDRRRPSTRRWRTRRPSTTCGATSGCFIVFSVWCAQGRE